MTKELQVLNVWKTVDGEANVWGKGVFSVFVRFAGCAVGCRWCDTKYSWNAKGGIACEPQALLNVVKAIGGNLRKVTITGGEPLEQNWEVLISFIAKLLDARYNITVETAGTLDTITFRNVFAEEYPKKRIRVGQLTFVVDYKLESSGYKGSMDLEHFAHLRRGDVVKFVVGNAVDFSEASLVARRLDSRSTFLASMYFSPCEGAEWTNADLIRAMIKHGIDQIGVNYNLQEHKHIWLDDVREEEDGGFDFTKRGLGRGEFLKRFKK